MLLAALIVGGLTAYYFGLRPGIVAAALSGALLLIGMVMPSKLLWAYGLVGAYTVVVLLVGPRVPGRKRQKRDIVLALRQASGWLKRLLSRLR
jgi:hypothetical protein